LLPGRKVFLVFWMRLCDRLLDKLPTKFQRRVFYFGYLFYCFHAFVDKPFLFFEKLRASFAFRGEILRHWILETDRIVVFVDHLFFKRLDFVFQLIDSVFIFASHFKIFRIGSNLAI
jgi:hypothetical protein